MTWISHKRNFLTPTQRPSSAPPLISATEDTDLDFAVQKLIYIEDSVRKMIKEMKKYLSAIGSLDEADQHLTTNLINYDLVHVSKDFLKIVEDYHSVTTQVGKSVQDLVLHCEKTFIEPLKKLRDEFSVISVELAKREELVTNWKTCYSRMKKLQEKKDKTAHYIAKLERERDLEESTAKKLKNFHSELLQELQTFLNKRLDYIKPSVHALIMIHLEHYGSTTNTFTHIMPSESVSRTKISDEEFQQLISTQVNRIKGLTIVKDH
ncbi:bridging integrator 3 homolog [Belonocnema kinseyi]|uniref:bridging integrator 3 homolog n=1 Tax=Belonocnema kinseyi TaxID=2817044 RepID=UPI00143D0CCB|nr:bridging integrator 3 homolog [Belonocnema kinseyi]